jgi:hypothetical protein
MVMNPSWSYWVSAFVAAGPLFIMYLIGIVASLTQLRAFPRVALLVAVAFGSLLLISIVQMATQPTITSFAFRNPNSSNMTLEARQLVASAIASVFSLLRAAATGLLCYAAFSDRRVTAVATSTPFR